MDQSEQQQPISDKAEEAVDEFKATLSSILKGVEEEVVKIQVEKSDEQRQVEANLDLLFEHELLWRTLSEVVNKRIRAQEEAIPRQYVLCPFDDREEAKKLGARWDPDEKKWYALGDATYAKLAKWHPKSCTTLPPPSMPPSPPGGDGGEGGVGGSMHRDPMHRSHGVSPYTREHLMRFRK